MQTKDYLGQIYRLDRTIKNKMTELAEYKTLAYNISAVCNSERVQTSLTQDKIGNSIAKIEEMERKLDLMIDEYVDKKNLIISQIDKIEKVEYYEVLIAKYVEKKNFEEIAAELGYTFRHITRLHGEALQAFEKKYGKTYLSCP